MAIAEVAPHNGSKSELRESMHAFVHRHADDGMEKCHLAMTLDAVSAPVLMIGTMEASAYARPSTVWRRTWSAA